jgi:trk system potassium uptake protein TrkA
MKQQCAVIGLGTFGTAIARELARNGGEVIAIDRELEPVERLKDEVAYAVRLDAMDPKVLEAHDIHRVDVAIIAIGHHFESVVLIAVELMQLGVKRLMARVENATQKTILQRLGVTDIISPEEDVAKQVAQRLLNSEIIDLLQLFDNYNIVEVRLPGRFIGKTLAEVKLRERFQCNVIAVKRLKAPNGSPPTTPYRLELPLPQMSFMEGDTLLVLGLGKDVERLAAV